MQVNVVLKFNDTIFYKSEPNIGYYDTVNSKSIEIWLSLSKKIEKLWKEGTEEAMIKAGKLLAEEIMTDTTDNAGLIDKIAE